MEIKKVYRSTVKVLMIALGNFLLALAVHVFILPYHILSGGVAGVAVALSEILSFRSDIVVTCLVWGLFLLGSVFLGKRFVLHTALSSIMYPLFLSVLGQTSIAVHVDVLLASLYGGLIAGAGVGLVFRQGASTGGMDIPPLIIHQYTGIELSRLVFIVDILTVSLGFFVFGIEAVLIGFVSVWSCSIAIKKVLVFGSIEARSVMIISENVDTVVQMIAEKLDRGSTLLEAQGGYRKEARKVILTVINMTQYPELIKQLNELDPHAFVIATDTTEVKGNGFSFDFKV